MNQQAVTVLTQNTNLSIIQFNKCGHIGFRYKNLLLKFREDGFQDFLSSLEKVNFKHQSIDFGDGVSRLIVNTTRNDIQFCFSHAEFKTVLGALAEASLMLQVDQILKHH